ncbi:MAG: FemAB family XrtA/PEP-CTERM system-associated protein [Candidatus Hodarchaeota archaeon]
MNVEELKRKDEKLWDDFVAANHNATFFHQIAYKTLVEKCYKYKPIYLIAKDAGEVNGILPLFLVNNIFLGKRLISLPFATVGGVCSNSIMAISILIDRAVELTNSLHCDYLEIRSLKEHKSTNVITKNNYFWFLLQLDLNPLTIWKNIGKTNRRLISKAKKNNLRVILNSKDFKTFLNIYSQGQRNLGTPIQDYKWLNSLFFDFPDNHSIALVEYNGKVITAIFSRYFKNTVSPVIGYSFEEYRHLNPMRIILWELIEDACRKGYEWFNFGRSVKSSGAYSFKAAWRAKPLQLYYHYYLCKSKKIPDTSQESVKRQLFAKVWKKLPMPVANRLGPPIRKYFP